MIGLAVVGLGFAVWYGSQLDDKPSRTSSTAYAPTAPARTSPAPLTELRPPVGTANVLTMEQLRYCLSEKIRLGSAESAVNSYNGADVDRFNAMVDDYNSRCGSFRYRTGTLETVRAQVEANRWQLEAQGRGRFQ
jgi:hypothetical protein